MTPAADALSPSRLAALVAAGEPVRVDALVTRLGRDAPLAACVVLSLPNALPGPPSPLCFLGLPALALALASAMGFAHVPLPALMARQRVPVAWLRRFMPAGPRRAPRLGPRVTAALCAVLCAIVALPVPGTTMLPAAAVVLLGLGVLEADGRLMDAGLIAAAAGLATSAAILCGLWAAGLGVLAWLAG
jgi:hypothetical protein